MTFFSVLFALIFEQICALSPQNRIAVLLKQHVISVAEYGEAGRQHSVLAWLSVVVPWTLAAGLIYYGLYQVNFFLAFLWNIAVVYATLGFRQFSHSFTSIQKALNQQDVERAREVLHAWTQLGTTDMPVSEIVRHALIHAVIAAHRRVFGVFFWFLMPIGPAGAVLYRVAEYLAYPPSDASETRAFFGEFARKVFFVLDWIPVRLTAFGFAIVGNFEEAIHAWRSDAQQWPDTNNGVLLAAGGGALGMQLMGPVAEPSSLEALTEEIQPVIASESCTPHALQLGVGLVWRAVVLWMVLLLMLTCAVWFG